MCSTVITREIFENIFKKISTGFWPVTSCVALQIQVLQRPKHALSVILSSLLFVIQSYLYFVIRLCWCCGTVPNDPRLVIVQKLAVIVEGQPDIELDLTSELCLFSSVKIMLACENGVCSNRMHIYCYYNYFRVFFNRPVCLQKSPKRL